VPPREQPITSTAWSLEATEVIDRGLEMPPELTRIGFRLHRLEMARGKDSLVHIWRRASLAKLAWAEIETAERELESNNLLLLRMKTSSHPWLTEYEAILQDFRWLVDASKTMVLVSYIGELNRTKPPSLQALQESIADHIQRSLLNYAAFSLAMERQDFGLQLQNTDYTYKTNPFAAEGRTESSTEYLGISDSAWESLALDSNQAIGEAGVLPEELPRDPLGQAELLFLTYFRWTYSGDNEMSSYQSDFQNAWDLASEGATNGFDEKRRAIEAVLSSQSSVLVGSIHDSGGEQLWDLPREFVRGCSHFSDNSLQRESVGFWINEYTQFPPDLMKFLNEKSAKERRDFSEELNELGTSKNFLNSMAVDELLRSDYLPSVTGTFSQECWDGPGLFSEWLKVTQSGFEELVASHTESASMPAGVKENGDSNNYR
jgi:hypothetical protein